MPFSFQPTEIPDVVLIEAKRFGDARGFFMETYQQAEFAANGIDVQFVQDNRSHSTRGVLRGLHYQLEPFAQGKLLMALTGVIFDVAVDIRRGSPTYGRWVGEILSMENGRMLYIPPGFAHGFCVLSDTADLVYKVSAPYSPEYERGIAWNDPAIGVDWPVTDPILSARDQQNPILSKADNTFVYAVD